MKKSFAQEVKFAVLLDSDKSGKRKKQLEKERLPPEQFDIVMLIGVMVGMNQAGIEDLIPRDPFLEAVLKKKSQLIFHTRWFSFYFSTFGRIAFFICKDCLRLCDVIADWVKENNVDFIVVPSLSNKVLPFNYQVILIFNEPHHPKLKKNM